MTRTQLALLTLGDPERVTGGYLFHRRMGDRAVLHEAELHFVSIPDLPLPWAMASGPWWLGSPAVRRADVVVVDSIAAAAAAPWLGRIDAPIVGMLHQPPGGMERARLIRSVSARFDRWAYRRAEVLMVASDWLAEQLVVAGIAPGALRVVPPGKDPVAADGDDAEAAARLRVALRAGRRIAGLCVANWLPRKGITELLEAVRRLPDDVVTLHLVGDTSAGGSYGRQVDARLARPDLRSRAVVHGVISAAAVGRLYRAADAFILPSYEEPYGTVWGEAMAAGLPVIGWQAANLPFLADHGVEGLLVAPGDIAGLAGAIATLAHDDESRRRMAQAAAARASARPTWDETAAMFFGIIGEVSRRVRAPGGAAR